MSGKLIVLLIIAICGTMFVSLGVTRSHAADCTNFDDTVSLMTSQGGKVVHIAPDKLADEIAKADKLSGETFVGVTRAFELSGPGGSAIGLEIAGCLLDPVWIWRGVKPGIGV